MVRRPGLILLALVAALTWISCDGPTAPGPIDPSDIPKPRAVAEEDYVVFDNGLKYYDFKKGTGDAAKNGDIVAVHYHGWLTDSTMVDSSFPREEPLEFMVGTGHVIKGWDLGVLGMKEGGERQLVIPPDLAYGSSGYRNIPANATLIFELFMIHINE